MLYHGLLFSRPLTLIIISLFQKKSRGNVAQNENEIFVQNAEGPGALGQVKNSP